MKVNPAPFPLLWGSGSQKSPLWKKGLRGIKIISSYVSYFEITIEERAKKSSTGTIIL
jgi:hypothetical protein